MNLDLHLKKVSFDFSVKNIPLHSEDLYTKTLIRRTETFVKNLRWRTFFFLNPQIDLAEKETYGLNSTKPPPIIPELKEFESDPIRLIEIIKFQNPRNNFQLQQRKTINSIKKKDNHLYVPADKTNNYYRIRPEDYEKLKNKPLQKEYKKSNRATTANISMGDKKVTQNLGLADRINVTAEREAFIALKDHKENFYNNPTCRLINPCETEIGKISKQILERINTNIRRQTKYNQWTKTRDVIHWFENITNKKQQSFIIFDICDFYPSITKDLLEEALDFASLHTSITGEERNIILHTKNSTLYSNNEPWQKRQQHSTSQWEALTGQKHANW
ncbi:hypothetical protein ElyMa_004101100 [Elysia marginata]|uniref:Reverse transcriptase domain-containing protein n=1 Tax=Elysia marginata TaxID=1093978 RepID=A0AAV4GAT8_9GAST|nr:hypothetical protein ElyMa_004101100 [Elysia marginata]